MKTTIRLFLPVWLCILSVSCQAGDKPGVNCDDWLRSAVKQQESVPPPQRFAVSLEQIRQACKGALPRALQQAITEGKQLSNDKQLGLLQQASATYFPRACAETRATASAKSLPHICLGEDFNNGPYASIVENVAAASYQFGKAVEQELLKSGLDKQQVKRFMLNYFLGAAHSYEQAH